MRVERTPLDDVLVVEVPVFHDARGRFMESWSEATYAAEGIPGPFVQDNVSVSRAGVLRGLHFQEPSAQGKLVSVLRGSVFDVAVDVRVGSPSFGRWVAHELSEVNARQLWIPEGFAHGFLVLSDEATLHYKCTAPYTPSAERTLRWNDPDLAIAWPVADPIVSARDDAGVLLRDVSTELLPRFTGGAAASPPPAS